MAKFAPIYPGEILRTEFLDELGISPYSLAKNTGIDKGNLSRIVNGKSASYRSRPEGAPIKRDRDPTGGRGFAELDAPDDAFCEDLVFVSRPAARAHFLRAVPDENAFELESLPAQY